MSRMYVLLGGFLASSVLTVSLAAPVPKPRPVPRDQQPNSNAVIKQLAGRLQIEASTAWAGYPPQHLIDEKLESTWYSDNGDCCGREREPWINLRFDEEVSVSRVTILGSRDPQFPGGYGVQEGQLLLLDAKGRTLVRITRTAKGVKKDFEFLLAEPVGRVKSCKFRVLKDDSVGNPNSVACVALSELLVE